MDTCVWTVSSSLCVPNSDSLVCRTCPIMVLAMTSALLGPLSASAALKRIWARSWMGFRSHSLLAATDARMALLMSSCISHIHVKRQTSQRFFQSYTCFSIKPPEEEAERNFAFELKQQKIDFNSVSWSAFCSNACWRIFNVLVGFTLCKCLFWM